jgi:hypothetical protein
LDQENYENPMDFIKEFIDKAMTYEISKSELEELKTELADAFIILNESCSSDCAIIFVRRLLSTQKYIVGYIPDTYQEWITYYHPELKEPIDRTKIHFYDLYEIKSSLDLSKYFAFFTDLSSFFSDPNKEKDKPPKTIEYTMPITVDEFREILLCLNHNKSSNGCNSCSLYSDCAMFNKCSLTIFDNFFKLDPTDEVIRVFLGKFRFNKRIMHQDYSNKYYLHELAQYYSPLDYDFIKQNHGLWNNNYFMWSYLKENMKLFNHGDQALAIIKNHLSYMFKMSCVNDNYEIQYLCDFHSLYCESKKMKSDTNTNTNTKSNTDNIKYSDLPIDKILMTGKINNKIFTTNKTIEKIIMGVYFEDCEKSIKLFEANNCVDPIMIQCAIEHADYDFLNLLLQNHSMKPSQVRKLLMKIEYKGIDITKCLLYLINHNGANRVLRNKNKFFENSLFKSQQIKQFILKNRENLCHRSQKIRVRLRDVLK